MYLRDVFASLLRRWYLGVSGLAVTAGLAFGALQLVPPVLESTASVVLLPPKAAVQSGDNPYLQLGGLQPTLDLLVVSLQDQKTADAVKAVSSTAGYRVEADTTNSGPVLIVTVDDRDAVQSVAVRDRLVDEVPVSLAALQNRLSIAERSRITSIVLVQDPEALKVGKNQVRAVVVTVGAGLVGTAYLVALIDAYLARRKAGEQAPGNAVVKRRSHRKPTQAEVVGWDWDQFRPGRHPTQLRRW